MQQSLRIFVDVAKQQFMVTCNPVAKIGDRKTGLQKVDQKSGLPMWVTELTALAASGASVLQVTTASQYPPEVSVGEMVLPEDLEALPWSNKDRDGEMRMGIAFRATTLRALTSATVS